MSQETTEVAGPAMKECPFCAEKINTNAKKCKHCGETIDVTLRVAEEARRASSGQGGNIVVTTSLNNAATQQTTGSIPASPAYPPKSRSAYVILALLFGAVGIHNFYGGYIGRGIIQFILGCTGIGAFVSYPWAILEAFFVVRDGRGVPFA